MATIDSTRYFSRRWEQWKDSYHFPKLIGKGDYTFTFWLGRDDFGFEYGNFKKTYNGPKLDLTGATVQLRINKLGYPPSLVQYARGEDWRETYTLCTVTGTVTDAEEGEVTFDLDTEDSDGLGDYLGQIKITLSDESEVILGGIHFYFHSSNFS